MRVVLRFASGVLIESSDLTLANPMQNDSNKQRRIRLMRLMAS